MFCSQCGKEIADNSKFCPECGKAIETIDDDEDGKGFYVFWIIIILVIVIAIYFFFIHESPEEKAMDRMYEMMEKLQQNQ